MADIITLRLGGRGVMTLPRLLRETYDFNTGDEFTLLDNRNSPTQATNCNQHCASLL